MAGTMFNLNIRSAQASGEPPSGQRLNLPRHGVMEIRRLSRDSHPP